MSLTHRTVLCSLKHEEKERKIRTQKNVPVHILNVGLVIDEDMKTLCT